MNIKTAILIVSLLPIVAIASPKTDLICSYAPSQSSLVKTVSGAVGGAGATALAITQATGLTAVAHSSGATIFTGSSGYIAGTLGGAAAAPFIIGVSIIVGTGVATIELLCTPKNHPEFSAKVMAASQEFLKRSKEKITTANNGLKDFKEESKPKIAKAKVVMQDTAKNVFAYAYRKTDQGKEVVWKKFGTAE